MLPYPVASWRRKWQSTPGLLPGKCHGQRSLVGYSPWDCKELDMTERLHFHLYLIGRASQVISGKESTHQAGDLGLIPGSGRPPEGNGNGLQYSCLGNLMDRGTWKTTVHGVTRESDMT